jgi:hypothetical protein
LLILAIDGVDRALLYDMLRAGELPHLAALLGGSSGAAFSHACFYDQLVTVLPSTTIAAWTTLFTGADPGAHGITGNELFDRSARSLIAPAPVSIDDVSPVLALYTDDSLGERLDVPTLYEKLREAEPHLRIWVAMSPRRTRRSIGRMLCRVATGRRVERSCNWGRSMAPPEYPDLNRLAFWVVVPEGPDHRLTVMLVGLQHLELLGHRHSVDLDGDVVFAFDEAFLWFRLPFLHPRHLVSPWAKAETGKASLHDPHRRFSGCSTSRATRSFESAACSICQTR